MSTDNAIHDVLATHMPAATLIFVPGSEGNRPVVASRASNSTHCGLPAGGLRVEISAELKEAS